MSGSWSVLSACRPVLRPDRTDFHMTLERAAEAPASRARAHASFAHAFHCEAMVTLWDNVYISYTNEVSIG